MKNKIIFLINKEMIIIEENIQNIKKNAEYINDIFENGVGSSVTIDMSNISGIQSSILIKTIKILSSDNKKDIDTELDKLREMREKMVILNILSYMFATEIYNELLKILVMDIEKIDLNDLKKKSGCKDYIIPDIEYNNYLKTSIMTKIKK